MATDYTPLVLDMLAAFAASPFDWYGDAFCITHTYNAGSFTWPWEYRHTWNVSAKAATRDALIRHGWIERLPPLLRNVDDFRLTSQALALIEGQPYDWRQRQPCYADWRASEARAIADMKANPHQRRTL